MTNLDSIIPSQWRKVVYAVVASIGLVLGGISAGYGAIHVDMPLWLVFTLGVYAFIVGPGTGLLALANTPASSTAPVTVTPDVVESGDPNEPA